MGSIAITAISGIVIGVILLILEYGVFKRRRKGNEQVLDDDSGESKTKLEGELPWPEAINNGLASFGELHKGKQITVDDTNTTSGVAVLLITVRNKYRRIDNRKYTVLIEKTGAIFSIRQDQ
jgi:hypothetical protein